MDTLLTTRQLQALLQVDRITIYRMLNDGRLQGFKVGGQWRFSRQLIEQWLEEQRAAAGITAAPDTSADVVPSAEALPVSCIQAIQDVFAQALGVGTVTTGVDGKPLTPLANSCAFCNLVLSTSEGRQRCIASWRAAAEDDGDGPISLATCHAGLRYVWGRIVVRGQFVAATHAGQFRDRPPVGEEWTEDLEDLSATTGLEKEGLQEALAAVPALDKVQQQKVSCLLQRVTATFSEIGEERLELLGRLQRIAEISRS